MHCGPKRAKSRARASAARPASEPPSDRPEETAEVGGPRPRARRSEADDGVLGRRAPWHEPTSMGASIAPASHGQREATRLSPRSIIRACNHCTQAGGRVDARGSQGHKGLKRASRHARITQKSCIPASTTRERAHDPLQPDTHLNRRRTLPKRGPKCGVIGRAPPSSKQILVFLGLVRKNGCWSSISTSR